MTSLFWILIALAGLAVIMSVVYGIMLWRIVYDKTNERLDMRLKVIGARIRQQTAFLVEREYSKLPWLNDRIGRLGFLRAADKLIVNAGYSIYLDRFLVRLLIGAGIVVFVLTTLGLGTLIALGFGALALVAPFLYLKAKIRARQKKFEEQLPDVLDFVARALQAGHAFSAAIQMAANESPQPIAGEFARVQTEINFGVPTAKALADLAQRVGSPDMRFFAVAVSINREVGGDLGGLLEGVSTLIRERVGMRDSVRAMTAEGRLSAIILGVLPFMLGALLMVLNPGMMSKLWTDPTGRDLLFFGLGLMAFGALWMRKMIRIRV